MKRPVQFDDIMEGKSIEDRLRTMADYLESGSPEDFNRRWNIAKQYLLWLATEG